MRGWYTGDDGTRRATSTGSGRRRARASACVNLDNSLYFAERPDQQLVPRRLPRRHATPSRSPACGATRTLRPSRSQAGQPLDVTLAWTDAPDLLPAGHARARQQPRPDRRRGPAADLRRQQHQQPDEPGGRGRRDARREPAPPDSVNPTERIRIANPAAGTYTITVTGSSDRDGEPGVRSRGERADHAPAARTSRRGHQRQRRPARHADDLERRGSSPIELATRRGRSLHDERADDGDCRGRDRRHADDVRGLLQRGRGRLPRASTEAQSRPRPDYGDRPDRRDEPRDPADRA